MPNNVSRRDYRGCRTRDYLVRVTRGGKTYSLSFADGVFGRQAARELAGAAARLTLELPAARRGVPNAPRPGSRTGAVGVCERRERGKFVGYVAHLYRDGETLRSIFRVSAYRGRNPAARALAAARAQRRAWEEVFRAGGR